MLQGRRYSRSQKRDTLPELHDQVYEVLCEAPRGGTDEDGGAAYWGPGPIGPFPIPRDGRPVFIALVDTAGSPEYVELVKTGLAAALEALPPHTMVGLITVSDQARIPQSYTQRFFCFS